LKITKQLRILRRLFFKARWGEASSAKQRPKQLPKEPAQHVDGADIGALLLPVETEELMAETNKLPVEVETWEPRAETKQLKERDAATTSYLVCQLVLDIALMGVCAWWTTILPVFNKNSGLWRRRRMQQSTFADLGIFALAGAFLVSAASAAWFVLKTFHGLADRIQGGGGSEAEGVR
jgi:hypothetical protein